ncbi:MAG: MFS transporter, partial [Bryobacteraceae bacterium]
MLPSRRYAGRPSRRTIVPEFGWRSLYAVGGALPLLFAIALWAVLPESPRFLSRRPALWRRLALLLTRMGHTTPVNATFEDLAERGIESRVSVRALFSPGLARDTAGLWIAFFFCLGSVYLVFGWLPTMLTAHGLDLATASSGLAVYNFGGVVGILIWAMLVSFLGSRRPLLAGALAGAGSALA